MFAELASLTGGRSFQPRDPAALNAAMRTIASELRHQYLIGYTPTRTIWNGAYRKIQLETRKSRYQVRTRDGYYALP